MRLLGWGLIQSDSCPFKKRRLGHRDSRRKAQVKTQEGETPVSQGGKRCKKPTSNNLALDLQPPERGAPRLRYFQMVAVANESRLPQRRPPRVPPAATPATPRLSSGPWDPCPLHGTPHSGNTVDVCDSTVSDPLSW